MAAFRFAVVGTGRVARAFVLGLRAADGIEVGAVGSQTPGRARAFADALGLQCPATDHAGALAQPVDAVYVATPPSSHRDLALLSLQAGRPVLLEKPFTTTGAEAREVVAEAGRLNVFCMEAMWTRFLPLARRIDALLRSGAIGAVTGVTGSLGSAVTGAAHHHDPGLGGGALLDRGVYPLSFVIRALGRPTSVVAQVATGASGVDEECVAVLKHRGEAIAELRASFRGELSNDLRYVGTEGTLWVRGPVYRPPAAVLARTADPRSRRTSTSSSLSGESWTDAGWALGLKQVAGVVLPLAARPGARPVVAPYRGNGYHYQAEEVARCVRAGLLESPSMPWDESVAVMETVDRIRVAAA